MQHCLREVMHKRIPAAEKAAETCISSSAEMQDSCSVMRVTWNNAPNEKRIYANVSAVVHFVTYCGRQLHKNTLSQYE